MKQVIRTIIAYFNGHEFIKEQVDSILNQEGIENFDNQVYIYDDGSKKESIDKLIEIYKDEQRVKVFENDGKGKGVFYRFLIPWADAINDNVDYIFWADQDDVFLKEKYIAHINAHNSTKKTVVVSSDYKWFFETNKEVRRYRNCRGHNMSFDVKQIKDKYKFSPDKFKDLVTSSQGDIVSYAHHDTILLHVFLINKDVHGLWSKALSKHRVHSNSITNSGTMAGRPWRIWTDQYNAYFLGTKPFIKEIFGLDQSISRYNARSHFGDKNGSEKHASAGWIKWKLDNLAMYIRCKFLRNVVLVNVYGHQSTKQDRKESKIAYKKYIKEQKAKWSK